MRKTFALCATAVMLALGAHAALADDGHSLAYDVTHAIGLRVDDAKVADQDDMRRLDAVGRGVEAGLSAVHFQVGIGILNWIGTSEESMPHVFGWVPRSQANTADEAQSVLDTAFLLALGDELGGGFTEVSAKGGSLKIAKPGCSEDACHYLLGSRSIGGDARLSTVAFAGADGESWGPVGEKIVIAVGHNKAIDFKLNRDLAVRVSTRLPEWAYIYLPGNKDNPPVVLQSGKALYFATR